MARIVPSTYNSIFLLRKEACNMDSVLIALNSMDDSARAALYEVALCCKVAPARWARVTLEDFCMRAYGKDSTTARLDINTITRIIEDLALHAHTRLVNIGAISTDN